MVRFAYVWAKILLNGMQRFGKNWAKVCHNLLWESFRMTGKPLGQNNGNSKNNDFKKLCKFSRFKCGWLTTRLCRLCPKQPCLWRLRKKQQKLPQKKVSKQNFQVEALFYILNWSVKEIKPKLCWVSRCSLLANKVNCGWKRTEATIKRIGYRHE